MCVRRYEDNWQELKGELMEKDVLEVMSLSAFGADGSDLEEKLRYCGEKDIRLQVKDARMSAEIYLDIVYLMKREEEKRKEELKKAQYKGIVKALEKKKEGEGSYGRPRARLPEDFREQVLYHQEHKIPLENYRRKTTLKKATFYKYVKTIQSEREEAGKKQERYQTIS